MCSASNRAREFHWPIRVYYEDTDAGGIVYHAQYLNFMERARTEFLRTLGFEQDEITQTDGVFFVVKKIAIDYLVPARFNDEITVASTITRCGRANLEFAQDVVREATPITRAQVKVACIDATSMRPCAIPSPIYAEILNVAG